MDKSEVKKAIKVYMDSDEFKSKIEKIVKEKLKNNRELDDRVLDITRTVIAQLFKVLWLKRGTWQNNVKYNKG